MSWYVARCLDQLLAEINASAPGRSKASDGSIGDPAHASRTSDHNPCDCHSAVCARDYTHDPGGGFDSYGFAHWLVDRCARGVERRAKYVISNGSIASAEHGWYWRPYDGSNPHDHHVHVSVAHPSSLFDDPAPWGWHGADPPEEGLIMDPEVEARFDKLEQMIGSVGAGQNKHIEMTADVDTAVGSVGAALNKHIEQLDEHDKRTAH